MYGRGAVDMKGGIACFVAAIARHIGKHGKPQGSVSFLITGDEEGPSINGTSSFWNGLPQRERRGTPVSSASLPIPTSWAT